MTSLPIASNNSQPSGNALNAAQASLAAGDPVAGLFAALLAQQIGVDVSLPMGDAPPVIAIDGIAADGNKDSTTTKDATDQTATIADVHGDAATSLAAMLLQLPQEPRTHESQIRIAGDAANIQTMSADSRKTADIAAFKGDSNTKPDMANLARDKTDVMAAAPDKHSISEVLGKGTVKHAELAAVPASPSLPTTNTAQMLAPAAAMANNILTGNRDTDNPQAIGTPLGSAGWANEFSQKIMWMGTQQNQVAELHLNPPDLGPLSVSLSISDNQATALFTSPHGAVRDAVENALPKLREMLADNGIMLGNATVNDQTPRDRSTAGFMNHGSGTNARHMMGDETPGPADLTLAAAQSVPLRRHNGMVDTFA